MKQAQKVIKFFVVFLTMLSALSILAKDPAQGQNDIFYSIAKQDVAAVKEWTKNNSHFNLQNSQGQSALTAAVLTGNIQLVKIILKTSVEVNKIDANGMTALDVASDYGYAKIALKLIRHGAKTTTEERGCWVIKIIRDQASRLIKNGLICLSAFLFILATSLSITFVLAILSKGEIMFNPLYVALIFLVIPGLKTGIFALTTLTLIGTGLLLSTIPWHLRAKESYILEKTENSIATA